MLRTVTFSDKAVADRVNARYVPAWHDRGPGFRNNDLWSEKRIFEGELEAYPTKNICTFFLTPEGRVFYYAAGSYSPGFFQKVLDAAETLRTAMFDDAMRPRAGYLEAAAKIHLDRSGDCEDLAAEAREGGWQRLLTDKDGLVYRGRRHVHGPSCGQALAEGYGYLSRLHAVLAGWTDLPELDQVRYSYEYGNEFTEESADAHHIVKPPSEESKPVALPRKPRLARAVAKGGSDGVAGVGLGLPGLNVVR